MSETYRFGSFDAYENELIAKEEEIARLEKESKRRFQSIKILTKMNDDYLIELNAEREKVRGLVKALKFAHVGFAMSDLGPCSRLRYEKGIREALNKFGGEDGV